MRTIFIGLPIIAIVALGIVHGVMGSRVAGYGVEMRELEMEKQELLIQQRELTSTLADLGSISNAKEYVENSGYISQVSFRHVELPSTALSFAGK